MNAQVIRRPTAAKGRAKSARKAPARKAQASAAWPEGTGKLARYAFLALVVVMGLVAVIALDLPGKAFRASGAASGEAGFAVAGYQISGKTGTAQQVGATCKCYDGSTAVSFGGFAPADDARFTVYVVIKKPRAGASGGGTAGGTADGVTRNAGPWPCPAVQVMPQAYPGQQSANPESPSTGDESRTVAG